MKNENLKLKNEKLRCGFAAFWNFIDVISFVGARLWAGGLPPAWQHTRPGHKQKTPAARITPPQTFRNYSFARLSR
jgi:hypothetical protein